MPFIVEAVEQGKLVEEWQFASETEAIKAANWLNENYQRPNTNIVSAIPWRDGVFGRVWNTAEEFINEGQDRLRNQQ
jgi:hypothetical protein